MRTKMREIGVLFVLMGWGLVMPQAVPAWTPTRPVEAVVHTGPGGGSDIFARAIADLLQKEGLVPQRLQVVNKSGGGPTVAMAYLAEKKGQDHTIAFFTGVWVTNPLTRKEAKVTVKDLTHIARLVLEPAMIAVKSDSPFASLAMRRLI